MTKIDQQRIKSSEWISVSEAARIIGNSESYIRELIQTGKVKTRQHRQTVLVNRSALLTVQQQAAQSTRDLQPSQIALTAIEQRSDQEQQERNRQALRLLADWTNATGDEALDQVNTLKYLIEHLDQDHANREIFPGELREQLYQILANNE